MSNEAQSPNVRKFDLGERTAKFGEEIIEFAKTLERNEINRPLMSPFGIRKIPRLQAITLV